MKGIDIMAIIVIADLYGEEVREDICEFDKNTDIDELLEFATNYLAFRIPHEEDRKLWNKIIEEKWARLDDGNYYYYNIPFVDNEKWVVEYHGSFLNLQTAINEFKTNIKLLTRVKNLYGGQF